MSKVFRPDEGNLSRFKGRWDLGVYLNLYGDQIFYRDRNT